MYAIPPWEDRTRRVGDWLAVLRCCCGVVFFAQQTYETYETYGKNYLRCLPPLVMHKIHPWTVWIVRVFPLGRTYDLCFIHQLQVKTEDLFMRLISWEHWEHRD